MIVVDIVFQIVVDSVLQVDVDGMSVYHIVISNVVANQRRSAVVKAT